MIRRTSGEPLPLATIVLDPGHGGSDAGIIGPGGTREKNVALQLAREMQRELQGRFGLRVVLTREGDYAMAEQERVARANSLHASLYLSLHMKGGRSTNVQGTDLIVAPPPEAVSPASSGGAASKTGGTIEVKVRGEVLRLQSWELLPASAAAVSRRLAASLAEAFRAANPFYPVRLLELPVAQLVGLQAPAVLVEAAPLVNPAEEVKLQNAEFLRELARILATGIVQILGPAS
ncbi:MAG: N-acetylmuramoyl-L-alanine amidase [Candidatus Tectomicrobia bacterium]|nr:N-acetylmuramoyl-L-alanine amidase [Candidatus Tectomicrobia bacterium]